MITLASIIRNGEHYIPRYMSQVHDLMDVIPDLRHVVGEGDSHDDSRDLLHKWANLGTEVIDVSHGGPAFGSIDHPVRWENIAKSVRMVMDHIGNPGHKFIWVEADLVWDVDTMMRLLSDTEWHAAVAPLVLHEANKHVFYDTWGFRIEGATFTAGKPWMPKETLETEGFYRIDSCGSCFVANTDPGYGNNIRTWLMHGWDGMWPATCDGLLWMDSNAEVYHP